VQKANGFANRFIWLWVERSKYIPNPQPVPDDVMYPIIEKLRAAIENARAVGQMERSAKAETGWANIYSELNTAWPGLLGAITSRAAPHVMRLACIYALMDGYPTVYTNHLRAAYELWKYSEASVRKIFGEATGNPCADRIVKELKGRRQPMALSEIGELFGRHRSREVDIALDLLERTGTIVEQKVGGTGGRARTIYKLVERKELE